MCGFYKKQEDRIGISITPNYMKIVNPIHQPFVFNYEVFLRQQQIWPDFKKVN